MIVVRAVVMEVKDVRAGPQIILSRGLATFAPPASRMKSLKFITHC